MGEEPVFDGTDQGDEEVLEGDMCPTLVVRQMCLTLVKTGMSGCTIIYSNPHVSSRGKVCRFVIDASSCENKCLLKRWRNCG